MFFKHGVGGLDSKFAVQLILLTYNVRELMKYNVDRFFNMLKTMS